MTEKLEVEDLQVRFDVGKRRAPALDGVSLSVPLDGYTLGIVGESGSGKTTLGMSVMNAIEPPGQVTRGRVSYAGKNVLEFSDKELRAYRWEKVSMVYQSAMNSLNPVKRAIDPIVEVLQEHRQMPKEEALEVASKLLLDVGIKSIHFRDYPHELSGGMRQRVVIALALALSPRLLIADEPTSALDVVTQKNILSLLKQKASIQGLSLVFITHEISVLNGLVDHVAVMYAGEIVEQGELRKVLSDPKHPYTEMLLGTLLTLDTDINKVAHQAVVSGRETRADRIPVGNLCKFAGRCKYAFDRCWKERPEAREIEKNWWVSCHKYQ